MNQKNNQQNQKQVQFQYAIRGNFIQEIAFKGGIPADIISFGSGDDKQQYNKNFNLSFRPIGPNLYEVILNLVYITNNAEQQRLYSLEMKYGSIVEFAGSQDVIHYVMFVEVPKIIYPYARAAIMNFLSSAGHKVAALPMIDFLAMFEQNKNSIATQQQQLQQQQQAQQAPIGVVNPNAMPSTPDLNFGSKNNTKKPSGGSGSTPPSSVI